MDVIITGSSRGIGFELVKLFTQNYHRVLAISRNIDPLNIIKSESELFDQNILPLSLDLASKDFEKALSDKIEDLDFKPSILINNAGLLIAKPIEDLNENDFDQIFGVNVKGPFLLIKSLLPYFSDSTHIVNISSMGGFQGSSKFSGLSLYSASKGALSILTECIAEEWKGRGIITNALALGATQTEMLQEAFPGYQAPVTAASMAGFIYNFALTGHQFFNGKVLPVSVSTP
jgi:3-oxoacyl-[acyl-carrier protein] reductase